MQTFGSFIVTALCASMAAGSVLPTHNKESAVEGKVGSFSVNTPLRAGFDARSGPVALANAYLKYGKALPEKLQKAAEIGFSKLESKRATGSATATPDQYDSEYTVPVAIGTPSQTLTLDFDTGSSDLWVFSSELSASSQRGHHIYTPSKSSTASKGSGLTWSISYGDGSSSSGDVYFDKVTIGGLTVSKQAVEAAQKASSQFVSGDNDGLVGLAFSSINTVKPTQQKTWFDNIKSSLNSPIFTADLKHNAAGSYLFGAVPSGARTVYYTAVDSSGGFWSFKTSVSGVGSFSAIADTGTTLILGSEDLVDTYYENVQSAYYDDDEQGVLFDCSETLPSFTFTVGSGKITVPGSYFNYAPSQTQSGYCYGGLQQSPEDDLSIFGDVALKAAYVVFDGGKTQVGWSQKV